MQNEWEYTCRIIEEIQHVLGQVRFGDGVMDLSWGFEVRHANDRDPVGGFMVRASFRRPDTNTGEWGRGFGRWMHIPTDPTVSSIVKTAWLCCELIVRHEMMEAFHYKKMKLFNPHHTVADLKEAAVSERIRYMKDNPDKL